MTRAVWLLLALFVALFACGDDDAEPAAPPAPPPEPAAPRPALPAPQATSGPGAFDLSIAGDEVLWLVGGPSRQGGGIQIRSLDAHGAARGAWRTVVPGRSGRAGLAPEAIEIEARAAGDRLGVAWVEREQLEVRTRSVLGDGAGRTFGTPVDLPARPLDPAAAPRGRLATVGTDAGIAVLHRRADGPCESGASADCARFSQARLGEGLPDRGIGWSLPVPCRRPVVGAAVARDIRYHALCAIEEGRPRTTVFAIQYEPQYAHAEQLLAGCEPVGLTPFAGGVAVTGDCDDGRRGFRIDDAGRSVQPLEAPEVRCVDGRPVVVWGPFREELRAPRGGLTPLLPAPLAGPADRAVWTGEAILVATLLEREAVLRRYACDRGTFRRTDP